MALTSPGAARSAGSIQSLWLVLDDALHVQRVALHLDEWRDVVSSRGPVPGLSEVTDAAALAGASSALSTGARAFLTTADLEPWTTVPARYGLAGAPASPLLEATTAAADAIVADADGIWAEAIGGAAAAAAWWVGFFTLIRHRGVHHTTLTPVGGAIGLEDVRQAAYVVALGRALRVVEARLRTEPGDDEARRAYCRALSSSIDVERQLPQLLARLGELRLVDLVSTSIPWRGRFTKYAGGTGAGQVEA